MVNCAIVCSVTTAYLRFVFRTGTGFKTRITLGIPPINGVFASHNENCNCKFGTFEVQHTTEGVYIDHFRLMRTESNLTVGGRAGEAVIVTENVASGLLLLSITIWHEKSAPAGTETSNTSAPVVIDVGMGMAWLTLRGVHSPARSVNDERSRELPPAPVLVTDMKRTSVATTDPKSSTFPLERWVLGPSATLLTSTEMVGPAVVTRSVMVVDGLNGSELVIKRSES